MQTNEEISVSNADFSLSVVELLDTSHYHFCVKVTEFPHEVTLWTNDILNTARRTFAVRCFKLINDETHQSFGHDLIGQHWDLKL